MEPNFTVPFKNDKAASHADRAHARLAPSGATRWMKCPGSVRLSENAPDISSEYAMEGTAAHQLAERCLRSGHDPASFIDEEIDVDGHKFPVTEEMAEAVDVYIDFVNNLHQNKRCEVDIEVRLDMSEVHPDIFGTGDAVVYDEAAKHLYVCDFKYGRGVVVDPTENPQLMTYGVGAVKRYHNRPLEQVTLVVVQPRAPGEAIKTWTGDALDLIEFEFRLAEAAKATEDPNAELNPGDWCKFCKAAPFCPALRTKAFEVAGAQFGDDPAPPAPETLSADEIGKILRGADVLENWCRRVREYAHARAVDGDMPAGFKLVEKRATRKWTDEDEVLKAAEMYVAEDDLWQRKFKSPAQLEKVVGKPQFAKWFDGLTVKKSSGTVLAPVEDKRASVQADAVQQFGSET